MNAMQKSVTLAGALALALTLGGCGSDTVVNPPPPPPPPPPVQETIVIYGDNGGFPAETVAYIPFSIPGPGTVAATVDWTFASSPVAIAMTTDACDDAEAAFLGACSHIGAANISRTQKPKTVTGTVSQAGGARLWIFNLASVDESMAVQITLTRTRAASAPIVLERFAPIFVPVPNAAMQAVRAFQNRN